MSDKVTELCARLQEQGSRAAERMMRSSPVQTMPIVIEHEALVMIESQQATIERLHAIMNDAEDVMRRQRIELDRYAEKCSALNRYLSQRPISIDAIMAVVEELSLMGIKTK